MKESKAWKSEIDRIFDEISEDGEMADADIVTLKYLEQRGHKLEVVKDIDIQDKKLTCSAKGGCEEGVYLRIDGIAYCPQHAKEAILLLELAEEKTDKSAGKKTYRHRENTNEKWKSNDLKIN